MAEIDIVSKHLIQTYPADFARFALQRDDIEDVEVIESEQPLVKARRTDSLLRVRIAGEDALVHHEFQTTDHPGMPRRMAGYIGRMIEHYACRCTLTSSTCAPTPGTGIRATTSKSISAIKSSFSIR